MTQDLTRLLHRPLTARGRPADVAAFVVGAVTWIPLDVVGRLYLGELVLLLFGLGLPLLLSHHLNTRTEKRVVGIFFALGLMYLAALVATDLFRQTAFSDYARGWARVLVYLGNVGGLLVLGYRRPSALVAFIAGTAVSQAVLATWGGSYPQWKFGYAYPVTALVLSLLDARRSIRSLVVLCALGFLHLLMDFRIFAAMCVTAGLVSYAKGVRASGHGRLRVVLIAAVVLLGFTFLLRAGLGLMGSQQEVSIRRQGSNVVRLAGLVVAADAIRESPLIGQGSWPRSDDALVAWAQLQFEYGGTQRPEETIQEALLSPAGATIRAHSMLLQAWIENGLPGLLFFGLTLVAVTGMFAKTLTGGPPDRHFALTCFFALWVLWAMLMSPFAGESRLNTAISLTLVFSAWSRGLHRSDAVVAIGARAG